MSLLNKVVIVSGASSGIGAAIAILFSKEGANVVLVARNEIKLKNVAGKCATTPFIIKADIGQDAEVRRIVEETVQKYGKIDILVNNAGTATYGCILDGKMLESFDAVIGVNLRSAIHLTCLATPHLVKSKGNIINISSSTSLSTPFQPTILPYSITKAGMDHFTRGAALELAPSGIRVNSINPGPVVTDFIENSGGDFSWDNLANLTPLKRVSQPEEIADLTLFLAGEKAKGITGSIFVADNGYLVSK